MSDGWYYAKGESTVGPVTLDQLQDVLKRQANAARVLVWKHGFGDWVEAGTVAELAGVVAGPPPLPSARVVKPPPLSPLSPEGRQAVQAGNEDGIGWGRIAGIAATIIGAVVGRIIGHGFLWYPIATIWLSYWAFSKLKRRPAVTAMLVVLVGHTLWMLIGHIAIAVLGKSDPGLLGFFGDFGVVGVLAFWAVRTQSVAASVGVLIYQALCLYEGAMTFGKNPFVDVSGEAVHLSLRVIGIGLAIWGIVEAWRFDRQNEAVPLEAPEHD